MSRIVSFYPPEFKIEAVQLVQQGERSLAQIASGCPLGSIGVSEQSLRNWVKRIEIDTGARAGLTTEERDELRRLRRENRILTQERDILKSAMSRWDNHDNENRVRDTCRTVVPKVERLPVPRARLKS